METEERKGDEEYLINELATQAGVTVRTIRYYTDEGLLPQPETRGKYAYYPRGHLLRLELIRRMKDAYLPLREIRDAIRMMSDAEVQRRLQETDASALEPQKPRAVSEGKSSALDYITRVRSRQSELRKSPQERGDILPALPPVAQPPGMPVGKIVILDDSQPGERWRRIEIAPGVELHLREPVDPAVQAAIEHFIKDIQQSLRRRGG
jgi:DNA-binding transcriptional MerR regulator